MEESMKQIQTVDKNFSTTRLAYKLLPEDYLDERGRVKEELKFKINIPELGIKDSKILKQGEEKFDTYLFLPPGEGRQGEGGLRTKGYFKFSYEIENGRWYACNFRGERLFEVAPPQELDIDLEKFKAKDGVVRLPLVSVITVVLNGEKYLEETIQSVINQTYPNVEYIIIDGGSTDRTVDIIRKYEDKIDYWVSEKDKGISDAFNKGLILSQGYLVNILNSDDFFENCIEALIALYVKNEADICYGDISYVRDNKQVLIKKANHKYLPRFMSLNHPATFIKKKVFTKIGFFNVSLKCTMDYDYLLRCYYNNMVFVYFDMIIANMRLDGLSDKLWKQTHYETFLIKRKYIKNYFQYIRLYIDYKVGLLKTVIRKFLMKVHLNKLVDYYINYFLFR